MFDMLRRMHPARMRFIVDGIAEAGLDMRGLRVLDVGCGIGLASESLARLGASVLGLDASAQHIEQARSCSEGAVDYRCATIENSGFVAEFDVVTALEVIEHCDDVELALRHCLCALKPGGLIFISTINRTLISLLLAKIAAEYLLRWVPIGVHDWRKFISPGELGGQLHQLGAAVTKVSGMSRDIGGEWRLGGNLKMNYILRGVKT
jgi:2-polyprenyl-6-hydroxyphenyl methylase/3-demethylubiquinone-9 3-methyltransferase